MQAAVPELMDLSGETAATKSLYGLDAAGIDDRLCQFFSDRSLVKAARTLL